MPNIRWRIGLFVFLAALALQLVLDVFVLYRLRAVQLSEVDLLLAEMLMEAEVLGGTPEFEQRLERSEAHASKWNETFVEVRAADGTLLQASSNLPEGGLGAPRDPEERAARGGAPYLVWNRTHPRSRKQHVQIRVAQRRLGEEGGKFVRVARTLKRYQKTYWRLREQLAWGILIVSLFAAAGASWVARRSLLPIDAMARRAASLGRSLAGDMPRSGSGDELDRLAEVLNEMLKRIRGEMQRVHRFTSEAAHALRTPLTALRGHLELLLRRASSEDSNRIVLALDIVDELTVLVNRMLLLERLQSSASDSARTRVPVQLDELVRDLVDAISVVAEEREIELQVDLDSVRVEADERALREAILNILDNALRHTPRGGWIRVVVRALGADAEVLVEDSGPGLRPDQLSRVFERFYSEREHAPGAGLGLAITQAVATAHGGSVRAASPAGARFVLRLPRSGPASPGSVGASSEVSGVGTSAKRDRGV